MNQFHDRAKLVLDCAFRGIYNTPGKIVYSKNEVIATVFGEMSTYDWDVLTRLVIAAHDQCVRVTIAACNPRYLRIKIHERFGRTEDLFRKHPTIEQAIFNTRTGRNMSLPVEQDECDLALLPLINQTPAGDVVMRAEDARQIPHARSDEADQVNSLYGLRLRTVQAADPQRVSERKLPMPTPEIPPIPPNSKRFRNNNGTPEYLSRNRAWYPIDSIITSHLDIERPAEYERATEEARDMCALAECEHNDEAARLHANFIEDAIKRYEERMERLRVIGQHTIAARAWRALRLSLDEKKGTES